MMGMTMTDTRTYAFRYRCRRGDVIAWAERHTYTYANSTGGQSEITYFIGIVRSVTRDGIVKTADTGFGAPSEVHHDIASAAVRCEQVDLDRARAWLASDANWPRRGSVPLRSMDEVRAVVRSWLRED
jgi:hypothetical protein